MDEPAIEREEVASRGRYVIRLNGLEAELTYSRAGEGTIVIDHTETADALRDQGLAGRLVVRAVEDARREGKKVVPLCAFAKAYIERHPELQDVLAR